MSRPAETAVDVLEGPGVAARTARGAGLRLGAYVVGVLLSVVSAAVLLRYLGVAEYGRYATVFALVTIVAGVTEAGTANVGVRELSVRPAAEHQPLLAALQALRVGLTAVGAALAFAFVLLGGFPDRMVAGAALAGAGLVLTVAAMTVWIPLQARLELARVAALEVIRQVLTVLVLLVAVAAGGGLAIVLGAQIPVAIGVAIAAVLVARAPAVVPRWDAAVARGLVADTLPYAAATAIGLVYSSSVLVVMSLASSATETGLYGAASRVFVVLAGIAGVLVGSAFPLLARAGRDDRERLRTGVQRLFDLFAAAATGLALVTAAAAPVAIEVVAGPSYGGAVDVLRILSAALIGSFVLALGAFALLSLGRQRALIAVNGAGLAVAIVLAIVVTPEGGAVAGAWATVAGETVIAVLSLAALARAGIVPSPRVVPRVLVAAALSAGPLFALGLPALPAAAAGAAVYGAAVYALGLVPPVLRRPRR